MGLLVPELEPPAMVVLSEVVAREGWMLVELRAATLTAGDGFTFEGGMREEGRMGGRVSPA